MNAPPSGQPPPKCFSAHVVKVTLPRRGGAEQAQIADKDGKLQMFVPAGGVSKRFARGERIGYFRAELDADGILELGERMADLGW